MYQLNVYTKWFQTFIRTVRDCLQMHEGSANSVDIELEIQPCVNKLSFHEEGVQLQTMFQIISATINFIDNLKHRLMAQKFAQKLCHPNCPAKQDVENTIIFF